MVRIPFSSGVQRPVRVPTDASVHSHTEDLPRRVAVRLFGTGTMVCGCGARCLGVGVALVRWSDVSVTGSGGGLTSFVSSCR